MTRKTFTFFLSLGIVLSVFLTPAVLARVEDTSNDDQIPEHDGTYNEPNHPGVRVRVFVHKEKRERIGQSASPLLVCGLSDFNSAAVTGSAGWKLPGVWTYSLNLSSAPSSVGSANLAPISANGFAPWTEAIGGKVNVTRVANTSLVKSAYDGKNIIAWGRASAGTLGVTYIRYIPSNGLVVDVDTILNKRYPWSWSNSTTCADTNSYDAQDILTHEIGHWFGLDDVYDAAFVDNTMYGFGDRGEVKKNTLTTGDIVGINLIYP